MRQPAPHLLRLLLHLLRGLHHSLRNRLDQLGLARFLVVKGHLLCLVEALEGGEVSAVLGAKLRVEPRLPVTGGPELRHHLAHVRHLVAVVLPVEGCQPRRQVPDRRDPFRLLRRGKRRQDLHWRLFRAPASLGSGSRNSGGGRGRGRRHVEELGGGGGPVHDGRGGGRGRGGGVVGGGLDVCEDGRGEEGVELGEGAAHLVELEGTHARLLLRLRQRDLQPVPPLRCLNRQPLRRLSSRSRSTLLLLAPLHFLLLPPLRLLLAQARLFGGDALALLGLGALPLRLLLRCHPLLLLLCHPLRQLGLEPRLLRRKRRLSLRLFQPPLLLAPPQFLRKPPRLLLLSADPLLLFSPRALLFCCLSRCFLRLLPQTQGFLLHSHPLCLHALLLFQLTSQLQRSLPVCLLFSDALRLVRSLPLQRHLFGLLLQPLLFLLRGSLSRSLCRSGLHDCCLFLLLLVFDEHC
mmetsp:Transcript_14843/g.29786  ORF Transcript_14843/g.29786 Transcript_14843/m.29786 type:complete len:463 (+) Transcript_14843:280-1668(+)